eukprot:TRINITY_DN282_c6_g1_i1.p2 TRINITY_DN282_c6_g1~~TRINITY_DN282_c6_g1_i1.p2  ORF type:complete len:446 (+),score=45.02 TRINITY_DN282_c6_g1_i1:1535-2872(+)
MKILQLFIVDITNMLSRVFRLMPACARGFAKKRELKDTFRFPSHKPYFNDDYYNLKFKDRSQPRGMTMQAYKQIFDTAEPKRDEWTPQEETLSQRIQDYIKKSDPQTMIKTTKEILKRKALNREFNFTEEERERFIENQYGDYDKYVKNFTEVKDAPFPKEKEKLISQRISDYKEKLGVSEQGSKRQVSKIYEKLESYVWNKNLPQKELSKLKPPPDWNLNEMEQKLFDTFVRKRMRGEPASRGRLSPMAKQEIYDLYLQGWSIQDLSHKFGILIERVRAIILQKHIFWNEIYPRLGETGLRMGLSIEMIYGEHYGFLEYGQDLDIMAENEKSLHVVKVSRKEKDREPNPAEKKRIIEFYKKRRPNLRYSFIPEKFIGTMPKGYLLKSLHVWKGNGRVKPTKMFMNACMYSLKGRESLLPEKVQQKLHQGPRKASKGYTPLYRKD